MARLDPRGERLGYERPHDLVEFGFPRGQFGRRNLLLGLQEQRIAGQLWRRPEDGGNGRRSGARNAGQRPQIDARTVVGHIPPQHGPLAVARQVRRQGQELVRVPRFALVHQRPFGFAQLPLPDLEVPAIAGHVQGDVAEPRASGVVRDLPLEAKVLRRGRDPGDLNGGGRRHAVDAMRQRGRVFRRQGVHQDAPPAEISVPVAISSAVATW